MPGPEPNDLQPDELVVLSLVESMEAPLPSSGEFIMGTAALTSQLTADTGELNLPDLGELILPDAAELNLDPVGFTETPVDELEEPDLEPVASTDALTPELEEFNLQPVESTEMPPPTNTEELSLQLLASLMLEDVQQLLSAQQESDLTFEDDTAALEASQMELEILLQSIQDQALAESLREAGASDFVAPPTEAGGDQSRADSLARLLGVQEEAAALYEKVECVSCGEMHSLHDILVTQCEHTYCKGCLIELFEHATRDEELYPVRCCRDKLPLERFKRWIAPDLLELYEEKRVEYESVDRIYCADPKCAKFITSENVDKPTSIATCSTCSKTTCKLCNRESHGNGECPEDITMQSLLEIARVNNWKRCYNCHSMIGISTGCNHMICKCKAAFCYECEKAWKSCECPLYVVDRLLHRAEVAIPEPLPIDDDAADTDFIPLGHLLDIVEDPDCMHELFDQVDPLVRSVETGIRSRCARCLRAPLVGMMECQQCLLLLCASCTRNRL